MNRNNKLGYAYILLIVICFIISLAFTTGSVDNTFSGTTQVQKQYVSLVKSFILSVRELKQKALLLKDTTQIEDLKKVYLQTRSWYKKLEFISAYYAPATVEMINGALIDKVAEEEGTQSLIKPEGLQVIEEYIWLPDLLAHKSDLAEEITRLESVSRRLEQLAYAQQMADWQVFEAIQLQLIRIITMGVTSFDSPYANNSGKEISANLQGIKFVLNVYKDTPSLLAQNKVISILNEIDQAIATMDAVEDWDQLDRLEYTTKHISPLYTHIGLLQNELGYKSLDIPRAFKNHTQSIFDVGVWNTMFFAPQKTEQENKWQVQLGKLLFFDPILSGNNKRACASCHQPQLFYTDAKAKSSAFEQAGDVGRNAPTIVNTGLQPTQFWDNRVTYLEDQVTAVTRNEIELHGNLSESVGRLVKSKQYKQLFKKAFKGSVDTNITTWAVRKAISSFERSLIALNSRFDQYMRGKKEAMSGEEKRGYNLFMGKAQCGTCHFAPLFGPNVPPTFDKAELEVLGVPNKPDTAKAVVDPDLGRYKVTKLDIHKYAFRTPNLRNVARTAPYMHNGVFTNLEQVVDFYNRGGGAGIGIQLSNQTLPAEPLHLNKDEQKAIVLFLKTLTDESFDKQPPKQLPVIDGDATLNKRTIGGEY